MPDLVIIHRRKLTRSDGTNIFRQGEGGRGEVEGGRREGGRMEGGVEEKEREIGRNWRPVERISLFFSQRPVIIRFCVFGKCWLLYLISVIPSLFSLFSFQCNKKNVYSFVIIISFEFVLSVIVLLLFYFAWPVCRPLHFPPPFHPSEESTCWDNGMMGKSLHRCDCYWLAAWIHLRADWEEGDDCKRVLSFWLVDSTLGYRLQPISVTDAGRENIQHLSLSE